MYANIPSFTPSRNSSRKNFDDFQTDDKKNEAKNFV